MGSKQKQIRQLQQEKFEQQLAKRKTSLAEKDMEKQKIAKDKVVEHLQAEINRITRAITAIDAREEIIEKAKLKKKNAEKMKADKPKVKKRRAEPAPAEKGKKEKKKKKPEKK